MARKENLSIKLVERLRFIDFLLEHYGHFNRVQLMDYFSLSTPQVSLDIQAYLEHAPGNVEFNRSTKAYERLGSFQRVWP